MKASSQSVGFSGKIASYFQQSQLTLLLALVGICMGIFAVVITPREEEPQINVTMANIFIPFPGASAAQLENLIATPMEKILGEINEVEHLYSVSQPGMATLTVQYKVGVPRVDALVRLYNAIYSNQNWRPENFGHLPVLIKPKGIDDVPIVALTLSTTNPQLGAYELKQIAHTLETELKRVKGTRDIETIGGPEKITQVLLDPQKLAARGLSITELKRALVSNNHSLHAQGITHDNTYIPIQAGEFLSSSHDLGELLVGIHKGNPVYLEDVATINDGPAENQKYVWHSASNSPQDRVPAVTLTVTKKPGENAVDISNQILKQVEILKGHVIPDGVDISVTRNYGQTADEKASKLIHKLFFATLSVVILVLFALGRREAFVVGSAIILTLSITLFASWAWGFTINRVSLFALIFSIGILVDDAIVIVENIHRHLKIENTSKIEAITLAVDEVGPPTILATFTVIAALLPMAFVSGLMGPYMSPIPINASMGMLISLAIALTFTPWLSNKVFHIHPNTDSSLSSNSSPLQPFFQKIMSPFLGENNRRNRKKLWVSLISAVLIVISLIFFKIVILKMLPFDNKSEYQVIVDLPEGNALEKTNMVLNKLSDYLNTIPDIDNIQGYAGTASPIGFNGLIRQYYLRQAPHLGELQVNLKDKHLRKRSSHEIAMASRAELEKIAAQYSANIKVVEVPPGPPVLAPLIAEVYGPDYSGQIQLAEKLKTEFKKTPGMADVDTSIEASALKQIVSVDKQKAAMLGLDPAEVSNTIYAALSGTDPTFLYTEYSTYPVPIRIELPTADKANIESILDIKICSLSGKLVPLSEVVNIKPSTWEKSIHHKDLLPVVYVSGDMAGKIDSPLYGMIAVMNKLKNDLTQYFIQQPSNTFEYSIKWDGEWQITYETFRDMGLAYSVGLILIYVLVVGQFKSYTIPLIIMAPIPLTLIGILPGHALLGAQFTATSMIGMIALAGIIVRNSILLVDFINHALKNGMELETAIIQAASIRSKPIILTGLAAMLGAFFILDDPIFNGLAVSLIFGILVSTLLTLVVIPLLYYSFLSKLHKVRLGKY